MEQQIGMVGLGRMRQSFGGHAVTRHTPGG
jgi:hypothetical protein